MKQELVAWEKEEQDKKDREPILELEEVKNKSTPEKVSPHRILVIYIRN